MCSARQLKTKSISTAFYAISTPEIMFIMLIYDFLSNDFVSRLMRCITLWYELI